MITGIKTYIIRSIDKDEFMWEYLEDNNIQINRVLSIYI